MPKTTTQSGEISLPLAITQYFALAIYLLVLMGFGTLASTGALDLPAIILAGSALALRGYLLAKRRRLTISKRWTTPLTLAYFIFYAADYLFISRSFIAATVHLVLFAVVVRAFSLRRDRDYVTLAILAFLMVLASAVLTVDSTFLIFFAGFMLTAVATFILMEMKRSGNAARFQAQQSHDLSQPDLGQQRQLAFSLARVTPSLALMILAGAAAIFFLLPRTSTGYMGGYSFGTDFSTGFSDRVELGRIGQIQQSNAVVMHIQIDGDQHGNHALRWRGVSLANFDGRNWSNPPEQYILRPQADGVFTVPFFSQGIAQNSSAATARGKSEDFIHYRVLMEPIGVNVFFLAPWPRRVSGSYRTLQIDSGGAISNLDSQRGVSVYQADSEISVPSPPQLRAADDSIPQFASAYLQAPRLDPRIPQLAIQISASASNNYDKAVAVESYLKTHFGYTLQLPRSEVADPLANFLFERKQGHCEYFASSMAVMLRALRIPARIVNGFRSDEFNDLSGEYVIRAKDAHSWVEAYFPGYGWISFDPTPGGGVGTPVGWGRAMLYLDAAQSFWREWVISYDSSHQYVLGQSALTGARGFWRQAREKARLRYAQLLNWARKSQRSIDFAPGRWLAASGALALLLIAVANAARIARMIRMRALRAHPEDSPGHAATMWYQRMARALARRGIKKFTAQTAKEFIRTIPDKRVQDRVGRFTDAYESARFGNSAVDASRLAKLFDEVRAAMKK
jgi:protein-glutamine gamma-glutamyltransferase